MIDEMETYMLSSLTGFAERWVMRVFSTGNLKMLKPMKLLKLMKFMIHLSSLVILELKCLRYPRVMLWMRI